MTRLELEQLCRDRKRDALLSGVGRWIKRTRGSDREFSDGMEWLWRAGMFKDVLLLSLPKEPSVNSLKPERLGVERALWVARAWGMLGAAPYAAQIIASVESSHLKTAESKVLAATVLRLVGEHQRALDLLPSPTPPSWSVGWRWQVDLLRLQSLSTLGKHAEVLEAVQQIQSQDAETVEFNGVHLRAILSAETGKARHPSQGVTLLESMLREYPRLGISHPRIHTYILTSLAQLYRDLGRSADSKKSLFRALHSSSKESAERLPHSEIRLLKLLQSQGWGSEALDARLKCYPYPDPNLIYSLNQPELQRSMSQLPADAEIAIHLRNEECWVRGEIRPSTPLELTLASYLARAGQNGIAVSSLYCLLWPNEAWNWFQFAERFSKLVSRLRKTYGISITRKRECLRISSPAERAKIQIQWQGPELPSFLSLISAPDHPSFKGFRSAEVAEYYSVSDRHALNLIQSWVEQGWVERQGSGPRVLYLRNLPSV